MALCNLTDRCPHLAQEEGNTMTTMTSRQTTRQRCTQRKVVSKEDFLAAAPGPPQLQCHVRKIQKTIHMRTSGSQVLRNQPMAWVPTILKSRRKAWTVMARRLGLVGSGGLRSLGVGRQAFSASCPAGCLGLAARP